MLHSLGWRLSHRPASDHAKMDAIVLEAVATPCGTARYGVLDADCDGVMVPLGRVYRDAGGDTLGKGFVSTSGFSVVMVAVVVVGCLVDFAGGS